MKAQLWHLAQRTTSLPLGRGAFTLATIYTLLTEVLFTFNYFIFIFAFTENFEFSFGNILFLIEIVTIFRLLLFQSLY